MNNTDMELGRVHKLCSLLNDKFSRNLTFVADLKVSKNQYTKEWRYDLIFQGSFGRADLNIIDEIGKEVDCYYELVGGSVNFSLSIPYKESLNE